MFRNSRHADAFQCLPTTFNLPKEYEAFEAAFTQAANKPAAGKPGPPCHVRPQQKGGLNLWILKPSCSSRGRGIYLVDDISAAVCSQPSIVQRYVTDPYLYQGYKFDLRLYVVVTSFNPLEAFIFKVRFMPDGSALTMRRNAPGLVPNSQTVLLRFSGQLKL
jgi:tubulin polyglutamylase TTLL5